MEMTT